MARIKSVILPLILPLVLVGLVTVGGCRQGNRASDRLSQDSSAAQELDSDLTFNNITLEQSDDQGKVLWKVKAQQAIYSSDKKVARVRNPDGNVYQDGKAVYRIQAQQGEVEQDGQHIHLQGDVVATDLKSGAILRGDQLEWQPKADLLTVSGNLRGSHPEVKISADRAQLSNKKREVELFGKVVAITQNPDLRLQSDHVIWLMDQKMVMSDRPVQVQRIQGKQTVDQANANQANVNLATKVVSLKQNVRLTFLDPPLRVTGNSLIWNVGNRTVVADQPVTATHLQQQVTATADRGRVDLKSKIAYLTNHVHVVSQKNQSQLTTDRLTWNIPNQRIDAEGNVVYTQTDPPATLKGPRAVGRLDNKTVVVSGGRVVTEIVPKSE